MTDDKSKTDKRDRPPIASNEDYGIRYLGGRTGITTDQVRELTERHGKDREKLMKEVRKPT